ncbi:MAG TPA: ABC transporter [Clostridiales bacterium]|nr:ABC transporter [Clostridiales bacterium]
MIQVENLTKEYITHERGSLLKDTIASLFSRKKVIVRAVDNISFSIPAGSIVGMLGPNGAGKSTTIKMLTGILTPTAGRIDVMGYDPQKHRTRYVSQIGAMFGQKSQLIWDIPAMDSFMMNKAIYNIESGQYQSRLDMLVSLLNAQEIIKKPVRVLSLGERMKCEFIIALLHSPKVVFLDEPTIGLDVIAKESIRGFIRDMNAQGVTFILTTHDLGDIESLALSTIIIDKGRIVFQGALSDLKRYLGNTKSVTITVQNQADFHLLHSPGLSLVSADGNNYVFNVDLDIMSMGEVINSLGEYAQILDISIAEPRMEAIVRAIYLHERMSGI